MANENNSNNERCAIFFVSIRRIKRGHGLENMKMRTFIMHNKMSLDNKNKRDKKDDPFY